MVLSRMIWRELERTHTLVIPYATSDLSGIRSMMDAPEDMKMNFPPLGMSGTVT